MRRPDLIARQSARPRGLLGWIVARVMCTETAADNDAVLDLLDPDLADRVLEIGFGHGRSLERLADLVPAGRVAGIDHSELMLRLATRRNRRAVEDGLVDLRLGDSVELPFDGGSFEGILAVHTLYFWPDPLAQLRECLRVLTPGGRLVLGYRPDAPAVVEAFPASTHRFYSRREVRSFLRDAGFHAVRIETIQAGGRLLEGAVATAPGGGARRRSPR